MISPRDAGLFRALCTKEDWAYYNAAIMAVAWPKTDLQILYGYMADLHKVTDADYTPADLSAYIESVARDEKLAGLRGVLDAMHAASPMDRSIMQHSVRQFTARQLAFKAAQDIAATHTDPERFNPGRARELLERATEVYAGRSESQVLDWLHSGLPDVTQDRPNRCPLGLSPRLDAAMAGGPAAGELCVFLAGPKKGKTSLLALCGLSNARAGRTVLHVTLEVGKEMARARYDAGLTGLDYETMCLNPQVVESARKSIAGAGGAVHIVDWQYEEHSPSELIPLVRRYQPNLVIVDYLELMIPDQTKSFSRKEQRHLYSKLGKDMRGTAKMLGVPVVTAWQVNREGSQADVTKETYVSECWDVIKHADSIIGISCTDEERNNHMIRVHTILQRFSEQRCSVRFRADFGCNTLKEITL